MYRQFPGQVMMPQPGQTLPPPISPGQGATMNKGGFGQGLARYMDAYRGERRAKKAEAERKFYSAIDKMFEQGLRPSDIDLKKMSKWAKEADLPFDFENIEAPPPPPPPQAQAMGIMPGGGVSPSPSGMPPQAGGPLGTMNGGWPGGPANPTQAPGGPANTPGPAAAQRMMMDAQAPQQGGQGRGIKNALRQAMGMPAPPSAAHEQGVMNMLRQIHERGAPSREAQQIQTQLALMGLRAQQQVVEHMKSGGTMDDPRIMPAMRILQLIGKGFPKDSPMGRKIAEAMAPEWAAEEKEAAVKARMLEQREKLGNIVAGKVENLDDVMEWIYEDGDSKFLEEAYGKKRADALVKDALSINKAYILETPEQKAAARAFSVARESGAPIEDILGYIDDMGPTVEEKRLEVSQQNANTSTRNASIREGELEEKRKPKAWMDNVIDAEREWAKEVADNASGDALEDYAKSAVRKAEYLKEKILADKELDSAQAIEALKYIDRQGPRFGSVKSLGIYTNE